MERETFEQFKTLLLGIPGWNSNGSRRAFLQDVFWGHDLLNQLNHDVSGGRAAIELIELLAGLESPDIDGLIPACALLKAIRDKYGAGPQRETLLAALERRLCATGTPIRSVLFCAANPADLDRIRTDAEFREIQQALARSPHGTPVTLHPPALAAHAGDLSRALLDTQPSLLHFSGHGGSDGIYFEDEHGNSKPVAAEALAGLLHQFSGRVRVVVLNACFSQTQAEAIAGHIDYVIGTRRDIGDDAAIAFSVGFYQALAAADPVEKAFQLGCTGIRMQGIPGHSIPVLLKRSGEVIHCEE